MPLPASRQTPPRAPVIGDRLGLRLLELSAATGMSMPTIWRRIKSGQIKIVRIGDMPLVPRAELIRLGLIDA